MLLSREESGPGPSPVTDDCPFLSEIQLDERLLLVRLCTIDWAICIRLIRNKGFALLKGGNSQMDKKIYIFKLSSRFGSVIE